MFLKKFVFEDCHKCMNIKCYIIKVNNYDDEDEPKSALDM